MSSVLLAPQQSDNDGRRPRQVISENDDSISTVAYLPGGRYVVTGSNDGNVRVWDVESGEQAGTLMKHDSKTVKSLAVTRDGTKIITIDISGRIKIWGAYSHKLVTEWTHPGSFPTIAISPDDRLIAIGYETMVFYTMGGKRVNHPIEVGSRVASACFSPDGHKLACGTGYNIRVYDVESGTHIVGPFKGHKDWVRGVLWSRDSSRLFSVSYDKTIRCWSADTGEPIGEPWAGHTDWVCFLAISPDGTTIASASNDRTVRLWDATSGNPVGQCLRHDEDVTGICFSPTGESVVSVGSKGMISLWRLPWSDLVDGQLYDTDRPITTSVASSSHPALPTHEPNPNEGHSLVELRYETSTLVASHPPPLDLTRYITKSDDQYVAGGGFGDVYRCRYLNGSPKEVAVKAFRFKFTLAAHESDRSVKMFRRELGIWRRLNHPNVVPFLGISYGFGMRGAMSLVSLWMPNESLSLFLAKHDDHLDLGHRLQFLLDIANGLHYLHSFPIVHGDLNCNNVLLDADYTARLADFGYASLVGNFPEALTYLQRSTVRPGALRWIAPEQIESEETFNRTPKSDIYSFSCIALQASFLGTIVGSELT
ncbi:WD40-repeat-containing domain protein [Boletus reticuloceps]|uniref:WD40-repeat-containing domain protein n=1 Tax=Boletus reticuloceps TaxID=495285 RepID=A0A8I3AH06_9AGAM|nr:WD40-repeat-containing domain protein [Boletus reticuloceps]